MFKRNRKGTDSSIQYNGEKIPKHKSMLILSSEQYVRSQSVGGESENPLPLNISVSAPTTPRNESGIYCKAISEVNLRLFQQRKEEAILKLLEPSEESTSNDEYHSAYEYSESEKKESSTEDLSELGIEHSIMGTKAKQLPQSKGSHSLSYKEDSPLRFSSKKLSFSDRRQEITCESPRRHHHHSPRHHSPRHHSPRHHSPRHHSPRHHYSPRHRSLRPIQKTRLGDRGYLGDNESEIEETCSDGPLPDIPRIKLPRMYHATLSRKLELKHPCSPRLSESRIHLEETKKVIELQKMLFELRVAFWQIENSREHAIENYLSVASEAGFRVCENCKRLLKDQHMVSKRGNYHTKRRSRRDPTKIYYKCTLKSYDQHFITTPAGKFFPLSFEK